ncbi:MAG: ABC transporter permease [Candidatus Aminicenantes bacterium]|nr:ABC transporter permease [Candidatus Aminicenantes bacterium]
MSLLKTIQAALKALNKNKMRSFLTMLGIIVGVLAVVAMISIGQGAKVSVQERISQLGSNLLFVRPGSAFRHGVHGGWGSRTSLRPEDAEAIVEECPSVEMVSPEVSTRAQVVYKNKNWNPSISGTSADILAIRGWKMEAGSFFRSSDVRGAAKFCILGKTVVENLFEDANPMGEIIRIRQIPFTVLGVLAQRGQSGGWYDQDDVILVPYTTAQKRLLGIQHINNIVISAVSAESMSNAEQEVSELLRRRHNLADYEEDDFNIRNMADVQEAVAETAGTMTMLLAGIASVSLLVGGIGIMNIMLVSVTERIREIGIRMSVGARDRDILMQFLVEAVVLSLTGGLMGIITGIIGSKIISSIAGWPTVVSGASIGLAFVFSAAVGVFFGFYPARKASKLSPIDALRYE